MTCSSSTRVRRLSLVCTAALPLCLFLSACGGGGGGGSHVASIPPPPQTPTPTPTPTDYNAPLRRIADYDLLGRFLNAPGENKPSSSGMTAGKFGLSVSKPSASAGFAYELNGPAGFLPGGLTSVEYGGGSNPLQTDPGDARRGSYYRTLPYSEDLNVDTAFNFDLGYSYVSMGEWEWWYVHLDGGTAGGFGQAFFVAGDRTPASGIPVSGTATYDAHTLASLASNLTAGIPFTLTADFGAQTIATRIDQDYRYQPNGDSLDYPAPGIHVAGSAPFSNNGTFDIPLTGTANYSGAYPLNTLETPPTQPVTGDMNGAFFGPHAEQVGGTLALDRADGSLLLQDAFVGQQHPH
jgi:hypothetical protein